MSSSSLNLLDYISQQRYNRINWGVVCENELKECLKVYPHFLEDLAFSGKWMRMPPNLFEFALKQKSLGEDKLIHFAARKGKIMDIPKCFLNSELLSLKGSGGQSVYHILAKNKETNLIDENLLTKDVLLDKDDSDLTPLHFIVMDNPELVFKRGLSTDDLFIRDGLGETPLYNWACSEKWFMIPDKFLTKETLGQTEDGPIAILDVLVQQHKHAISRTSTTETPLHSLEKLFKKLEDKELWRLEGDIEPSINQIAKKELAKRRVLKKIAEPAQCLSI